MFIAAAEVVCNAAYCARLLRGCQLRLYQTIHRCLELRLTSSYVVETSTTPRASLKILPAAAVLYRYDSRQMT